MQAGQAAGWLQTDELENNYTHKKREDFMDRDSGKKTAKMQVAKLDDSKQTD